jgi:hypothetical protein
LREVRDWLVERAARARSPSVLIDPGIGFAKTAEQSMKLLQGTAMLVETGLDVLIGASRKSFIGRALGQSSPEHRAPGLARSGRGGLPSGGHGISGARRPGHEGAPPDAPGDRARMRQELGAIGWLWASVRWTDILDIAIMAFLIYRTLLLMRGTRAFQSLVGLMFLLGLYFVAERLELTSVRWMLDKFIVYIVLAVIILFQQDIRRALARAGGRFFVSLRSSTEVPILRTSSRRASRSRRGGSAR